MEIFNIGIPELIFILLIMLVVLGPTRMESAARSLALTVRRITHSEIWRQLRSTRQQIEDLPSNLLRDSGAREFQKEIDEMNRMVRDSASIDNPARHPTAYPTRPIGGPVEPVRSPLDPDITPPPDSPPPDQHDLP